MKLLFKTYEPLALIFRYPAGGNACGGGKYLRNVLGCDCGQRCVFGSDSLCQRAFSRHISVDKGGKLLRKTVQPPFAVPYMHLGSGFVDKVNGLVWQAAVIHIPHGHIHRRLYGFWRDIHFMIAFVAGAETRQNLHSVLGGGLTYHDLLEAALQGGILADELAVFVKGGGADYPQLSTGKLGLQDICGVNGALCRTCSHNGVKLVNEKDNAAVFDHLVDAELYPVFKIAPVLCACKHRGKVKGKNVLSPQGVGYISRYDGCRYALRYGSLAHARFSHKAGVVFGAAGQYAYHPSYLFVTAENRVALVFRSRSGQILAVFYKGGCFCDWRKILHIQPRKPPARSQNRGGADAHIRDDAYGGAVFLF